MEANNSNLLKFIMSCKDGYATMSIRYANLILGNKQNLYRLVSEEGYYLPRYDSRCITTNYLLEVMKGSVFRICATDVKVCLSERIRYSKIDMISLLETKYLGNTKLGITPDALPNREWLVNVIYTIDPYHDMFVGTSETDKLVDIPVK